MLRVAFGSSTIKFYKAMKVVVLVLISLAMYGAVRQEVTRRS